MVQCRHFPQRKSGKPYPLFIKYIVPSLRGMKGNSFEDYRNRVYPERRPENDKKHQCSHYLRIRGSGKDKGNSDIDILLIGNPDMDEQVNNVHRILITI